MGKMKKLLHFARGKKENFNSRRRSLASIESNDGYQLDFANDRSINKLHHACWIGDVEKTRKHANNFHVDAVDQENRTALHLACARGHQDVALVLLGHKAKVNLLDANGLTPLLKAVDCEHDHIVKFLLERNVDPNAVDRSGNTGLHTAAKSGNLQIVVSFVRWKVNSNLTNQDGQTALHIAVKKGHGGIARHLLEGGTDLNRQDSQLRTPLIIACQEGYIEIVQNLLEVGADISLKDSLGWSAEDCAVMADHQDCAELVRKKTTPEDPDTEDGPHVEHPKKETRKDDDSIHVDSWDDDADTVSDKNHAALSPHKNEIVADKTTAMFSGISKFQVSLSEDSLSETSLEEDLKEHVGTLDNPAITPHDNPVQNRAGNSTLQIEDEENSWDSKKLESGVSTPAQVLDSNFGNLDIVNSNSVGGKEMGKSAMQDVMAELGLSDLSSGNDDSSEEKSDFKIGDSYNYASKSRSESNLLEAKVLPKGDTTKPALAASTVDLTGPEQVLSKHDNNDDSDWDDSEAKTNHSKPILQSSSRVALNVSTSADNSLDAKRCGSGVDISTDGTLGRYGTMQGVDEIWEETPRFELHDIGNDLPKDGKTETTNNFETNLENIPRKNEMNENLASQSEQTGGEFGPKLENPEELKYQEILNIMRTKLETVSRENVELIQKVESLFARKLSLQSQVSQMEIEIGSVKNEYSSLKIEKQSYETQLQLLRQQLATVERRYDEETTKKQKIQIENQMLLLEIENLKSTKTQATESKAHFITNSVSTQTANCVESEEMKLSKSVLRENEQMRSTIHELETQSKILKDQVQQLVSQNSTLALNVNAIANQFGDKDSLIRTANDKLLITEAERNELELEAKLLGAKVFELESKLSSALLDFETFKIQTANPTNTNQERSDEILIGLRQEMEKVISTFDARSDTIESSFRQFGDEITKKTAELKSLTERQADDNLKLAIQRACDAECDKLELANENEGLRRELKLAERELDRRKLQLSENISAKQSETVATQTLKIENREVPILHRAQTTDFSAQCAFPNSREPESLDTVTRLKDCYCNSSTAHNCINASLQRLNTFLQTQVDKRERFERSTTGANIPNQFMSPHISQGLKESIARLQDQLKVKESHRTALQEQTLHLKILASTSLKINPENKYTVSREPRVVPRKPKRQKSQSPSTSWSLPLTAMTSTPIRPKIIGWDSNLNSRLENCIEKHLAEGTRLDPGLTEWSADSLECYVAALKSKYQL